MVAENRDRVGHVQQDQPPDDGVERLVVAPGGDVAAHEADVVQFGIGRARGRHLQRLGRLVEADDLTLRATISARIAPTWPRPRPQLSTRTPSPKPWSLQQ